MAALAGDTVCAWALALDGGYTLADAGKPRFGAGFDWAMSDRRPNDSKVETFDQLFPLGHKYLGYLDLIGRQNIIGPNVNFSIWPVAEKVQTAAAWQRRPARGQVASGARFARSPLVREQDGPGRGRAPQESGRRIRQALSGSLGS